MVFRAERDPESSPAIGGIQAILDSRFRGNDGTSNFCKRIILKSLFIGVHPCSSGS
jgi:hypothetical protein